MDNTDIGCRLSARANAAARNRGIPVDRFLSLVCREQLLDAVGRVAPEGSVALKGSALVLLDDAITDWARPSKDIDLHLHGVRVEDLHCLLDRSAVELAAVGIRLECTARKQLWKPDGTPGGEKVRYKAWMGRTRVDFELDCWVGGQRSPGMRFVERASMLPGLPPVRMLAYPVEAMAADKLHAIAQFGSANTRIKDYYDLWHLSGADLDSALLLACVAATFANNSRAIPLTPVLLPGLGRSFAVANQAAWTKMLADAGRTDRAATDFVEIVGAVRAFANRAFAPAPTLEESPSREVSYERVTEFRPAAFA